MSRNRSDGFYHIAVGITDGLLCLLPWCFVFLLLVAAVCIVEHARSTYFSVVDLQNLRIFCSWASRSTYFLLSTCARPSYVSAFHTSTHNPIDEEESCAYHEVLPARRIIVVES